MLNAKDNEKIKLIILIFFLALFFIGYYVSGLVIFLKYCVKFYSKIK